MYSGIFHILRMPKVGKSREEVTLSWVTRGRPTELLVSYDSHSFPLQQNKNEGGGERKQHQRWASFHDTHQKSLGKVWTIRKSGKGGSNISNIICTGLQFA